VSQKSREANVPLAEAAIGLRRLAEPIPAGDRIKRQIERAALAARLSYTRASDLWYGKARRVDPGELEAIRHAQNKRRSANELRADELRSIAADFEAIAERAAKVLAVQDRAGADAFRRVAQRARDLADGAS
jgi:hypothetical protein